MGKRSEVAEQKYRPLKKMMKETLRSIGGSIRARRLPSAAVMDDFMAQAKVMVSYPGFGDERYGGFTAACDSLYKAFNDKDMILFADGFNCVVACKKECHKHYK